MTHEPISSPLDKLEQVEAREKAAAAKNYWANVHRLSHPKAELDTKTMNALRDDLRVLGLDVAALRADVGRLRGLCAECVDDGDPVAQAREARAKAKERAGEADAAVVECKRALAAAEEEQRQASWAVSSAVDAIRAAETRKANRIQRARDHRAALLQRGCPSELLPALPLQDEEPAPRIPHRVLKPTFHGNAIRGPGEVVYLSEVVENDSVRPLAEGEAETPVAPKWRVCANRNHRDTDGKLRMDGDVYETEHDPHGNPFLVIVDDDVPLGLGDGEQEQDEAQEQEQQEARADA